MVGSWPGGLFSDACLGSGLAEPSGLDEGVAMLLRGIEVGVVVIGWESAVSAVAGEHCEPDDGGDARESNTESVSLELTSGGWEGNASGIS